MARLSEADVRSTVERLRQAPKYRPIHLDTIADVVHRQVWSATSRYDLERRSRRQLHKVMAGYLQTVQPRRLLRGLGEALAEGADETELRAWCRTVLASHYSTAERLPDLDRLYRAVLDLTGSVTHIADLACGLGPFTLPWLRAETAARYTGYDLNMSYVELGNAFLARLDPACSVNHRDVLIRPEEVTADAALLLKTYHCIEDRQPGAALRLVDEIGAGIVVLSFPTHTVSGRAAPFTAPHLERLSRLAEQRGWDVIRSGLASEELVAVYKAGPPPRGSHGEAS